MSNTMRYTALGLAGAATILLVLCQFLPIQSGEESASFFGQDFGIEFNGNLWNAESKAAGQSDSESWFKGCDGGEDCDGIGLIRTGAIVLTAGLAAAAAAAILFAFGTGRVAAIVTFVAAALALAGFLFWTIGYGQLGDGEVADFTDPAAGFVLAIVAIALLAAAGVVGVFVRGSPAAVGSGRGSMNF